MTPEVVVVWTQADATAAALAAQRQPEPARPTRRISRTSERVLDALMDAGPSGLLLPEIVAASRFPARRCIHVLSRLARRGRVVRIGERRRQRYALAEGGLL